MHIASKNVDIQDIAVVSPDYLLLCNRSQPKIQLLDTRDKQVVSEVSMPYWVRKPSVRSLCMITNDQAAVTSSNRVQMINVQGQTLTLGTVIILNGNLCGVSVCGAKDLVVSYEKAPWLEVVSTDGKVLQWIEKSGNAQYFKQPQFLTTSSDRYIYVADHGTNNITKLDTSLQVLQTFSSPLLSAPNGIISISPEQLLVCSHSNHRIVLLNTRTCESSIVLKQQDGIQGPTSLSYCPQQKKLYLAHGVNIFSIQMFKLK